MPVIHQKSFVQTTSKRCLKCNNAFESVDPILNRLCPKCNKENTGYQRKQHGRRNDYRRTAHTIGV